MTTQINPDQLADMQSRLNDYLDRGINYVWEKAFHVYTFQDTPQTASPFANTLLVQVASGLPLTDEDKFQDSFKVLETYPGLAGRYASGVREFLDQANPKDIAKLDLAGYKTMTSMELLETFAQHQTDFESIGMSVPAGFMTHLLISWEYSPAQNPEMYKKVASATKEDLTAIEEKIQYSDQTGVPYFAILAQDKGRTTEHSDYFRQESGEVVSYIPAYRIDPYTLNQFMLAGNFNDDKDLYLVENGNQDVGQPWSDRTIQTMFTNWNSIQFGINPRNGAVISLFDMNQIN